MSLGHTEPIARKHALQKHPREESSGLDLKDLRFQEVLQPAGGFSQNWLQERSRMGFRPQVCLPSVDVRNMEERAKALEANSMAAPPYGPVLGTSGFLLQVH